MYSTLRPESPAPRRSSTLGLEQLLRGGGRPIEDVEDAEVDRPRRFGRELLADDRAQQGAVGVGGPLLFAPSQPRRRSIAPIRSISSAITGSAAASCLHRLALIAPSRPACASRRRRAIPSRKSSEAKQDSRRAISPASWASLSTGLRARVSIALLLPRIESGALAAIAAASSTESASSASSATTSWTRPICSARAASRLRPVKKSSLVRGRPTVSMNLRRPVWP